MSKKKENKTALDEEEADEEYADDEAIDEEDEEDKEESSKEDSVQESKKDARQLMLIIGGIVVLFAIFFLVRALSEPDIDVKTIDDLHLDNLQGKLDPSEGYIHNGFSFVKFAGLWYTQLQKDNAIVSLAFNYGPDEVQDIQIEGRLNSSFLEAKRYFITFDPEGSDLQHVAVANAGLSNALVQGFGFYLIAACTKNITGACAKVPTVTCDDEDRSVIFFKEANETKIVYDNNCVIIQGREKEIIRAKDRLLLRWYNIIE